MSELILNKQKQAGVHVVKNVSSVLKQLKRVVKPILFLLVNVIFIMMSVQHNSLFLNELMVSTGIISLIYLVHLGSQQD